MNTPLLERFKKVTSVTVIFAIVFSFISPVFAASITLSSVTVSTQTGTLNSGTPGSVTYIVTMNSTGSGNLTVTPGIQGALPTGATLGSFNPTSVALSNGQPSKTSTLTINTNALTPAGNLTFTIQAAGDTTKTVVANMVVGAPSDTTAPTISNITSTTANNSYGVGTVIPLDVTFSEIVTSTGNVTLTTDTGRTCTFAVTASTTGTCNYTVQAGDNSSDLNIASVSGTIKDGANLSMTNFIPTTNLSTNKAIVIDTAAPTLNLPANIVEEATSDTGNVVIFAPTSTDIAPVSPTVNCTPASGSTFPIGTTTVNCDATDTVGNTSNGSFTVKIEDTIDPVISADGSFLIVSPVTATGATITFTTVPTATDVGTPSPVVTCLPVSGTEFPLNSIAIITCNSTDIAGNTGVQTFEIVIEDEVDPALLLPGDISVESNVPTAVPFTVSATDNVDTFGAPVLSGANPAIVCSHLTGGTFFGTTIVVCTATDSEGNDATGDFNIIVGDTTAPAAPVVQRPSQNEIIEDKTSTAEGTCETDATVTISSTALETNPTVITCAAGTFATPITFLDASLDTTFVLNFTQTDTSGNISPAVNYDINYRTKPVSSGGSGPANTDFVDTNGNPIIPTTGTNPTPPSPTTPVPETQTPPTPTPETPATPTPETPANPTPDNNPTPTPETPTPTPEPTPENTETPTPTPTPTPGPTPTPNPGGTGGNPAPFNPADATLDIGGGTDTEGETETIEEGFDPADATLDVGGGEPAEESSYTLLWILLGLLALLNTWWFLVAKNRRNINS